MKTRHQSKKHSIEDTNLTKIPILGYFFRRIKESRQAIETALETGRRTKDKIRQTRFLGGLIKIISQKTFSILRTQNEKER